MIDWSKAPKGAEYYRPDKGLWYKAGNGLRVWDERILAWCAPVYSTVDALFDFHPDTITRPVTPEALNPPAPAPRTAADYCKAALGHMEDRAVTYDKPTGERSMGKTVEAFNVITGHQLTEEQGWLFMETLKMVRSQQGAFKADNYEDATAYASLRGEAAEKERGNPPAEGMDDWRAYAALYGENAIKERGND